MPEPNRTKALKILFVSAEMVPFAKEGGLADVAGALPPAMKGLGCDIRVVLPLYGSIDRRKFAVEKAESIPTLSIPMAEETEDAEIFTAVLPEGNTPVYLVANRRYFDRSGVYNDPKTGEGYTDNSERFIFFQKSAMELLRKTDWRPDLVHCNDHQTGLIPYYLKRNPDDQLHGIASLFSIHNLAYQGLETLDVMPLAEIPKHRFYPVSPFEFYGKVNLMKIGIVFADLISTVSPTYAKEIQRSSRFGFGLEGVLRSRASDLVGIVNGIDDKVWNPQLDELIPYRFSAASLDGKAKNKTELLRRNKLPEAEDRVPLVGMISRLAEQKGFDILGEALDKLMELNLQMVVLGTGKREFHELLESAAKRYPKKLAVNLVFDNELAHLIEAGADIFLMPSRYEPCGLNQLYSLRYGTIPVVRATGGLADTIKHFNADSGKGNGFMFKDYTPEALLAAMRTALETFRDQKAWAKLIGNAMAEDFSWKTSAKKYLNIYRRIIHKSGT